MSFLDDLAGIADRLFNINHQVSRSVRDVIATSLTEVSDGLNVALKDDVLSALVPGTLPGKVFIACQYPETQQEAVYVVTPAGQVIRVRVDAFECDDVEDRMANDADVAPVLAYVAEIRDKMNASAR